MLAQMSLRKSLKSILLGFVAICVTLPCCNGRTVTLAHAAWKGVVGYIPVSRQAVQEKLDFYNSRVCQGSLGGPLLFLPRKPVFPEILNESQHVVFIDFGKLTVYNSEAFNPDDVHTYQSTSGPGSSLLIPLLSNNPDAPPRFSLGLYIFHPRNSSDLLYINIMCHHKPVDELSVNGSLAVIRDDNEDIRVHIDGQNKQCQPATPLIRHELEMFLEQELMLGISQPEFPSCECHQEIYFCSLTNRIKDDVISFAPNVCQIAWGPPKNASCQVSLEVVNITPGFRERLLLGKDDPIYFIASETYDQYFDEALKFPCIDEHGN